MVRRDCSALSFLIATLVCWCPLVCLAAAPTAEDVFRVCRENKQKLDPLHVRFTYSRSVTDAYRQSQEKQADQFDQLAKLMESGATSEGLDTLKQSGYTPAMLREQAKNTRLIAKGAPTSERFEYFVQGDSYQVRVYDMQPDDAPISEVPVTAETLVREHMRTRIYTRSPLQTPAAWIWPGQSNPNSTAYVMFTKGHIRDFSCVQAPPYTLGIQPTWDFRHPIDTFFNATAEHYRVVGQEARDGRTLTIVDATVPHETQSSELGADGKITTRQTAYLYRAWLDLERGGVPVRMHFWHGFADKPLDDASAKYPPGRIITAEVERLPNGAWYPVVTTEEQMQPDPAAPHLSQAEWAEVSAGTRAAPKYIAFEKLTWLCSLVDTKIPGDERFFVLPVPKGQPLYDFDAKKVVGGLEQRAVVKAGEKAPPLQIGRWLDGQNHSLEEFRGKVVVVDFWGLWCGPCRASVPAMAALQEKYAGQQVVFISIHTADKDPDALAKQIATFATDKNWKYLAAIDAGTMSDNSATSHAYGIHGFPTQLIIGPDGVVRYNSDEPPPGMEGIVGKTQEEITPEDEKKFEAFQKQYMAAAGVGWPLPENMNEKEQQELFDRVNLFHLSRRIEGAMR